MIQFGSWSEGRAWGAAAVAALTAASAGALEVETLAEGAEGESRYGALHRERVVTYPLLFAVRVVRCEDEATGAALVSLMGRVADGFNRRVFSDNGIIGVRRY